MTTSPAPAVPTPAPTRPPPPRRFRWLRRLAWFVCGLLILLVAVYFIATSSAFFKGVLLPRVARAMNADIQVTDASLHPFSRVTLRGLTVRTTGSEPLMSVEEVRLRYSLTSILRGNIKVDEVAVVSPKIHVEQYPDGTSNIDPLMKNAKAEEKSASKPKQPADKSSSPPQVQIARVSVTDGSVHVTKKEAQGVETRVLLEKLNFGLNDLRNGQTAHVTLDGNAQWIHQAGGSNSTIEAPIKMDLRVGLTPSLGLGAASGGMTIAFRQATGAAMQMAGAGIQLDVDITPTEVKALVLRANKDNQSLGELSVRGPYDLLKNEGALDLVLTNLNLADWRAFAPEIDPAGKVSARGRLTSEQASQHMNFDFSGRLDQVAARMDTNRVTGLDLTISTAGHFTNFNQFQLGTSRVTIAHQGRPAAELTATGRGSLAPSVTQIELNGNADIPTLAQILPQPNVQVTSGRIQMAARVQKQEVAQSLNGTITLANLTGTLAGKDLTNFAIGSSFDLGLTNGAVMDLRRVGLQLAETARTKTNAVLLTGRLDFRQPKAIEGVLRLAADHLDVTPYYDLFSEPGPTGSTPSSPTSPGKTPSPPAGTNAPSEPEPMVLPVRQLTLDAQIGHLWLREIEATNVHAAIQIESNRVTIRPVALAMNSAPLDADVAVDLSVPGWRYNVALNAAGLPIAPLADSFAPDYRGRAKGDLWAKLKMEGAGVTGPNLRKNLAANLALTFTNADIQIVGPRLRGFLTPIAAALNAPGLLNSPLKWVAIDGGAGSGKLNFSQLALVSPAFTAATHGDLTLADNLSASRLTRWPMAFQLERALAERLRLAPKDTPTNATFVGLPDFIRVAGTLNDPKPDLDLKALASAALLKYVDKIPGVDEKTGNLLKGFGGLLSGSKAASTNAPASTNAAPATNKPSLLDLLKRPKL